MVQLTQNVIQWALPAGDVAQTSVWVRYGGTPTAAQAMARFQTNVIDTIWPSGAGGIKGLYDVATSLNQLETRNIDSGTGVVQSVSKAAYARPGTSGGAPLPGECSIVVTLRTANAGGSYRGRMYLPAVRVGSVTSLGVLVTADLTTMLTSISNAFIAMNADVTYVQADVVVRSRKLQFSTDVISVEIGNIFDSQRRRRNSLVEVRSSAAV